MVRGKALSTVSRRNTGGFNRVMRDTSSGKCSLASSRWISADSSFDPVSQYSIRSATPLQVQHARKPVAIRDQALQAAAQQGSPSQIGRALAGPQQEHGRAVGNRSRDRMGAR